MTKSRSDTVLTACTTRDGLEQGLRYIAMFGLVCLIAGMAVLPNAGHAYDHTFLLTLYLPILFLLALRPRGVELFWRQPSAKLVVLLLAWSALSLIWGNGEHTADWVGRALGIALFLYGWIQVFAGRERRIHGLLIGCGAILALTAIVLAVLEQTTAFHSLLTYPGGRLMGIGKLDHPNLAAAAMSAAIIWLCTYPCERLWQHVARAVMVLVLLAFVVLTFSRSAWGGLYLALLVITACREGRGARWVLGSLVLLGVAALLFILPELTTRGWSARPEILAHAWALFLQHLWLGVGQATPVHLYLDTFMALHAHNIFAQLAVQLGLPGLLMWVGIWLTLGWRGWLYRHTSLGQLVLATWVFATFMGQFDLPFLIDSPHVVWLITWLPLAVSYSLNTERWNITRKNARLSAAKPGEQAGIVRNAHCG